MVIVKDQYSHLVYLNTRIEKQICLNLNSKMVIDAEEKMKDNERIMHKCVCFQMPKKRHQV